jgi:hypothetical protein
MSDVEHPFLFTVKSDLSNFLTNNTGLPAIGSEIATHRGIGTVVEVDEKKGLVSVIIKTPIENVTFTGVLSFD